MESLENKTEIPAIKEINILLKVNPEKHKLWKQTSKEKGLFFHQFLERAIDEIVKKDQFKKLLV